MADIFINYRTNDEAYAAVFLDEKLGERFGRDRVFRDSRSIGAGQDFRPALWGALARSKVLIVVIGPAWLRRDAQGQRMVDNPEDFVRREIELALGIGIHVLPVLVDGAPKAQAADLPAEIAGLANYQYRRLTARGADHEVARILDDVAALLGEAAARPGEGGSPARPGTVALLWTGGSDSQHDALRAAVGTAAMKAGLPEPSVIDQEDGLGAFLPESVPSIRVVTGFLRQLDATLTEQRMPPVRVGVCQGTVDGRGALTSLSELVRQPELDEVLRRARRARLVLIVPDAFFTDVVRADPALVDPSTFLPLVARADGARHWVHVPGYPAPPGLLAPPGLPAPTPTAQQVPAVADNHGTRLLNHGPVYGDQFAGDKVMGDKHVYGSGGGWR